ncbi:thiamine phosphate synthase [Saccharibacillus sp. CPCC 101409]|uniref:thiamine phosphate synthase n=1 Tax=Saccharibacillus sp. CPCC 101409 TaxID=3058041 RepID=UPI002672D1EE|nr:thiamine phosphate synthase [Saccharibacillus sp. CPCC 101409]MDO3409789.1 thiamine phosphate synthase [Saccharibacillus sp. CPCC 101409]
MRDFRLYAITGENFHPGRDLVEVMEQAIIGGADIIQFRDKTGSKEGRRRKAQALRELTRRWDIPFIVNDDVDLALEVDADGIHLGQGDLPLEEARRRVGDRIIGISTHAIEEALLAQEQGADYIGAGPVYATRTKEDAVDPVGLDYIREVSRRIEIPFVAIGGIKLGNADEVIEAGAARLCAISEIVGSGDPAGVCRSFIQKLERRKG